MSCGVRGAFAGVGFSGLASFSAVFGGSAGCGAGVSVTTGSVVASGCGAGLPDVAR